ncbi:MAG: type IV pilus assembly protein PilP, partial [Halothiobacillaceae bacterium]
YRVKEDNFLGQNHGKIQLLAEDKIVLMELVPDGIGGWLEREAALSLVE